MLRILQLKLLYVTAGKMYHKGAVNQVSYPRQ